MARKFLFLFCWLLAGLALAGEDVTTSKPKVLTASSPNKWSAQATLLALANHKSALCRVAEADTQKQEQSFFNAFVESARQAEDSIGKITSAKLSYESSLSLRFNDPRLLSFRSETYTYMGGAHGMANMRTYNYGFVKGKPVRFRLWDALKSDADSKMEMHMVLLEKAMALKGADWIDNGEVTEFEPIQYDRFWVSGNQLVFEFDPYELGPFSSGPMSVRVSLKEIAALVRTDGPLAFLLK
ncbi:MAG: DUF3298 and DUF4163 domain-containing protein [Armatimonadetes bacterium]|nr:DUF3298 and DUF4163 domain-containing protein [Armatimonadota bacterium]